MRAARYLGVPVWDLEQRPIRYVYQALRSMNAEAWAQAEADKIAYEAANKKKR